MMAAAKDIDFDDPTEYVPAAVTIIAIPLTFSIADGIAFGLHRLRRHQADCRPLGRDPATVGVLAALFILRFALL